MPLPETAADLQKLLCAANWLHESIVGYAQLAAPLQEKLEGAFAGRSRKQRIAEGITLTWTAEEQQSYCEFLDGLGTTTKLTFPDESATVCLCTDASDRGWSLVVTQVDAWDETQPLTNQSHELVLCKGGTFKGAQLHWSIAEKEAYPIAKAAKDLEYLLHRTNGFKLFCDHANLIQIFCPSKEIRKHVRGKLQRWALMLSEYRYQIEHVKGTDNVWADLVSRWLTPSASTTVTVKAVRTRAASTLSRLRPLLDDAFVWPTADHALAAQQRFARSAPPTAAATADSGGLLLVEGRVWIPTQAKDLITRILITAHCGVNAHRGADTMMTQLREKYHIKKLREIVKTFVASCLLCKHVKGGLVIQRPWSEPRAPAARNETLHFDFLFMGESYGPTRYVLVLKDELTHYCELVACDSPTSAVTASAILDWAKRFGMPTTWISDNGSHFKNKLLESLRERLKAVHVFVPVYTPWVNGTVERINRDILQVMRVLLLEYQLDTKSWEHLLSLVQFNLNQTPVQSLGYKAPVELFTGLVTSKPLDSVVIPQGVNGKPKMMTIDLERVEEELDSLRESLAEMHQEVTDRKERTRMYQRMAKRGTLENFSIGDYVLWVVEALEYSYKIEHLLTGDVVEVHGSRLKFYDDASLDLTDEIHEHIAKQGIVMGVEEIKDHRFNEVTQQWELLISWRGLQDVEDSWEPLADVKRDIPLLIQEYVEANEAADLRTQLEDA
ncbi:hypothetical protein P43SY_011949 [Pythium insidiosum]|uniref:Integrase catalytic domain-containing protein n=1 Tax=Pythium insidiosum TaxID=114742 RepID=A0AAD5L8T7_PYTIN|nr:hypothetical protein P43SY_011949 [Pythium insidiosum]